MSAPFWDELAREHAKLRANVKSLRRDPVADTLGAFVMAAVKEASELRASGAGTDVVAAGLEQTVRERWPKGRAEDWHYECQECDWYGWRVYQCDGDATCGRHRRHGPHAYVKPCWCEKGKALQGKPKTERDELADVGKTRKTGRFDRFGR